MVRTEDNHFGEGKGKEGTPRPVRQPVVSERERRHQWRLRRNLLIYLVYRQGLSGPAIGDAFGLSAPAIHCIVHELALHNKEKISPRRRVVEKEITRRVRNRTPGQQQRFHRDLVVCTAYRAGISYRVIAEALEVPHWRVFDILKKARLIGKQPVPLDSGETEEAGA
jgi:hypothetical protein